MKQLFFPVSSSALFFSAKGTSPGERDQQLKTTLYIYRLLYQNLMGTANQKITIDTHTKKKKQPQNNIKMVTKPPEKRTKEAGKKEDLQK